MTVSAIVLAGGRSNRFGTDKLAADLDGRPLLDHAIAAVQGVADQLIVSVGRGTALGARTAASAAGVTIVRDPTAFEGPLAALAEALEAASGSTAIVVGGDMPRLKPALLLAMLAALEPDAAAVVLQVRGDAPPLPLALRVEPARAAAALALARGERSLRALVAGLEPGRLAEADWRALDPEADSLVDIDRPADLDRARASFEQADRPLR